jgi:hypothetical protein
MPRQVSATALSDGETGVMALIRVMGVRSLRSERSLIRVQAKFGA